MKLKIHLTKTTFCDNELLPHINDLSCQTNNEIKTKHRTNDCELNIKAVSTGI